MRALMRFRCWTLTFKFHDVKQNRSLHLGKIFLVKCKFLESCSQIPDIAKFLEKHNSMKDAEITFKQNLLNEFISECNLINFEVEQEKYSIKNLISLLPIQVLQERNLVSSLENITSELLSNLEPFPFDKKELWDFKEKKNINLRIIRNIIEKQYLSWKYQVDVIEVKCILTRYMPCLYKNRSLRTLRKNISLLETIPKIEEKSVAEKIYHINQKPFDLNSVITFQDKIAGVVWHVFPQYCPNVLKFSHEYIVFIVSTLQTLKFTERQIELGLPFINYDFRIFIKKLNDLLENPELKNYRSEPNFLQLLFFKTKFLLDLISSSRPTFKELTDLINVSRSSIQKRLTSNMSVLYQVSQFYRIDSSRLPKEICRGDFRFVPEKQIYETLSLLKEMGFTAQEVQESISIIFYPRNLIIKTFNVIKEKEDTLKKIGFNNGCVPESHFFTKGTKEKRKVLQLCLYYIEKTYNFSKDGIWTSETLDKIAAKA